MGCFKRFGRGRRIKTEQRPDQGTPEPAFIESLPIGPGLIYPDLLLENVWGSNLRGILPTSDWHRLRISVCEAARMRCELCGQPSYDPETGRPRRPDCHELWSFEIHGQRFIQRFRRLVALCPDCHRVQRIGLASARCEPPLVTMQLKAVNCWTYAEIRMALDNAADRYNWRRKYEWDLDLTLLAGQIHLDSHPDLVVPAAHRRHPGNSFFKS